MLTFRIRLFVSTWCAFHILRTTAQILTAWGSLPSNNSSTQHLITLTKLSDLLKSFKWRIKWEGWLEPAFANSNDINSCHGTSHMILQGFLSNLSRSWHCEEAKDRSAKSLQKIQAIIRAEYMNWQVASLNLKQHDSLISDQHHPSVRHHKVVLIVIRNSEFWRLLKNFSATKVSTCFSKVKYHLNHRIQKEHYLDAFKMLKII